MAFPGLKYASSGILAALRAGSRLTRRPGKKPGKKPTTNASAANAQDRTPVSPAAAPIASLAPLTAVISQYLDQDEVERVREAYRFADSAHLGQFRQSGSPYISHPIAVTEICAG
ncbi:MAG: guanosine-3',5'-bis(diphosphate) 3'-pyrophosphohydrolase, partial [Alcaligenaceae bacterium]